MKEIKKQLRSIASICRVFGLQAMVTSSVLRLFSFGRYETYMFGLLRRYFAKDIEAIREKSAHVDPNGEASSPIHVWTLWWQGLENAPDLVKTCIASQRRHLVRGGISYHVLTEANLNDYIQFPQFILDKVKSGRISLTHFSDLVRAELIRKYGGIWIDATVLCVRDVDFTKDSSFFTVKCFEDSDYMTLKRWTGFFIGGKKNSLLFEFLANSFRTYWEKEDELVVYLLIDYLIAIAYDQFPFVKDDIDNLAVSDRHLWALLRLLNSPFDRDRWDEMMQDTSFFKLSYKEEFNGGPLSIRTKDHQLSYWGYIFQNEREK